VGRKGFEKRRDGKTKILAPYFGTDITRLLGVFMIVSEHESSKILQI